MAQSAVSARLAAQVQWQHSKVLQGQIDQSRLSIAGAPSEAVPFSFMVMGDTDAGLPSGRDRVGEACAQFPDAFSAELRRHLQASCFLLHTGDVTYPTGSYENYWEGFLRPYQWLLSNLPKSPDYRSESIVFTRPLLPVPGNHDYAESGVRVWQWVLRSLCDRLRACGLNLGHYGGQGGEAYGQTFLDDLQRLSAEQLTAHLATHYSAICRAISSGTMPVHKVTADDIALGQAFDPAFNQGNLSRFNHCLNYQPGQFTRLPNRYYRFRYGGVDFFALDSNTWNTAPEIPGFDQAQLIWLEQALIESWQTPNTVGRIIYLHHSPYTTEATRWQQSETLWVRRHLRSVLNRVAAAVAHAPHEPWIDMVISGHAHCLEHVQTLNTGHADAGLDWVVCGGSGASLRRQREAGADILERLMQGGKSCTQVVAQSRLYASVHGRSQKQKLFHSFLRVEVQPHQLQKFVVRPFVVSLGAEGWETQALNPIPLGSGKIGSDKIGSDKIGSPLEPEFSYQKRQSRLENWP